MTNIALQREQLILRDGPTCQWPGCEESESLTIHHKVPRSLGGTRYLSNLVLLCEYHHRTLNKFFHVPEPGQTKHLRPGYAKAWQAMKAALTSSGAPQGAIEL